jgi:hypothetical protein
VLLFGIYYLLNQPFLEGFLHPHFPTLITFFFFQTLPIAWILNKGLKNPPDFPMYAMASIGLRMVTALFFLLILYALKVDDIRSLGIQFMGVYLVYLVFELTVVLANLRRN